MTAALVVGSATALSGAVTARASTAAAAAPTPATTVKQPLTQQQASVLARRNGKAVAVTGAETTTQTLTANPNGTFTLDESPVPVRKDVKGTWKPLSATLERTATGAITAQTTTYPLTLSGGGSGPLALMHDGLNWLSVTLPARLPDPVLSGDSATYRNVIPGVDLRVTASVQGGFSDVLIVHDAAAAASPALSTLLTSTISSDGLRLSTDKAGDLSVADGQGTRLFSSVAPKMWDSATGTGNRFTSGAATAVAAASSAAGPGRSAQVGGLSPRFDGHTLALTPDASLLRGTRITYPLYLDPTWGPDPNSTGWSTNSPIDASENWWDTSPEENAENAMQVGEAVGYSTFQADTVIDFPINMNLLSYKGVAAKIDSASFYITPVGGVSCAKTTTDLYAPSPSTRILTSSNANWDSWFTDSARSGILGNAAASATYDNGYSSSCDGNAGFSSSTFTSDIGSDVSYFLAHPSVAHTQSLAIAGPSNADELDSSSYYAVFDPSTPDLQVTYNNPPTAPYDLGTSPSGPTVGNGSLTLYGHVFDPDGGTLTAAFSAWVTGDTSDTIASGTNTGVSAGAPTSLLISQSTLDGALTKYEASGASTLPISWKLTVTDSAGQSASTTYGSALTFSTALPGAPGIFIDSGLSTECSASTATGLTVGTPTTLYLAPGSGTATPTSYTYQLNGQAGQTVAASGGDASIAFSPTSQTNLLTVNAVAASGNIGPPQTCVFGANAAADADPGDMTGDGSADLLFPGTGTSAQPAGLWLAAGNGTGAVDASPENIGVDGNTSPGSPADFTGTEAITGLFQGTGANDVLDYDPSSSSCSGYLLPIDGPGLPLQPDQLPNVLSSVFSFTPSGATTADCATSIASGGNLSLAEGNALTDGESVVTSYPCEAGTSGDDCQPDLLMIIDGQLVDAPSANGDWDEIANDGIACGQGICPLLSSNPENGGSFDGWTITTTLVDDIPAMFAMDDATGAAYYYSPADMAELYYNVYDITFGGATSAPYTVTPAEVADSGLTSTAYTTIEATTLTNGTVGLWAVSPSATVTTYLLNSAGTALTDEGTTSPLSTTTHAWALNDMTTQGGSQGSEVTTTADNGDSSKSLPLTGNSGTTWNTNDTFSPDVAFNGTSGYLNSAGGAAVAPSADFTVSAWVKPTLLGGIVFAQKGTDYPSFEVGSTTSGAWTASMNTAGTTGSATTTITGGNAYTGLWTQLTLTYSHSDGADILKLYADGVELASVADTSPPTVSGDFQVGAAQNGSGETGYFEGDIADVQAWNSLAAPLQPATTGSVFVPVTPVRIMDTRYTATNDGVTGPVGSDSSVLLPIDGNNTNGAGLPSSGITAVAVSVTVTDETAGGDLTLYPGGTPRPITSAVNFAASGGATNNAIVPVGPDGDIAIYNYSAGTVQLVIDLTGYFTTNAGATGASSYVPLPDPERIMTTVSIGEGATLTEPIEGNATAGADIPSSGVTAVAINLTAINSGAGAGYLIAWPAGKAQPGTSNLTYLPGVVTAGTVIVPVGSNGDIDIYNAGAAIKLDGDVSGYFTAGTSGQLYHPLDSTRIIDTRQTSALVGTATTTIGVPGNIIASDPTLVTNITATLESANGYLEAWPTSAGSVVSSILNFGSDQNIANMALMNTNSDNSFRVSNPAGGTTNTTDIIVDTNGYFQ
jgi:hypothetical protein